MATDKYPFTTGVRSNLIEEQIKTEQLPPSADTILIFGTATQGPLLTPIRMTSADAESIFGANVNDPYQKFNLMKGFREIIGSMPGTEVIGVRIGNAQKASLTLYESQVTSGNYAPQAVKTPSIEIVAKQEGLVGNDVIVTVYDDGATVNALPSRLVIELPNGITKDFDLLNDYITPAALAQAMNADTDVSRYVITNVNVLEGSDEIEIVQGSVSGQIETVITVTEKQLIDVTNVYTEGPYLDSNSILPGRTTADLAKTPIKDTDENTVTVAKFWTKIVSETAKLADNEDAVGLAPGTNLVYLPKANTVIDSKDAKFIFGQNDSIKDVVVSVKSAAGVLSTLSASSYTLGATGSITLNSGDFEIGSSVYVKYTYRTSYTEANVRSAIQIGNPYSYFVSGGTILFGAAQKYALEVEYDTKIKHELSAINLAQGKLTLAIDGNEPSIGDFITVEYLFNPELPGASGAIISPTSDDRQFAQLAGGTTGRRMELEEYWVELAKGYLAADNIPCRIVVPQGVYVDDVMEGLDFETGILTTVNAGFHTQLSSFLSRHSQYVSECIGIMSVRPMETIDPSYPTLNEKENWYNRLVNQDPNDGTVTANVVSSINDYHLVVTVGDLILSEPSISGGAYYVEGAHNIVAAMKLNHDNLASIITRSLPSALIRGMQYRIVASDRINEINKMRYTLITEDSDTGNLKMASAPTMALATSQFRKQYNLDIAIEAVNLVRRYVKKFIGQPNKASTRQAMKRLAEQKLNELSPDKLLSAQVNIIVDREGAIAGNAQIDLLLVTAVEIERINVRTRVELGF